MCAPCHMAKAHGCKGSSQTYVQCLVQRKPVASQVMGNAYTKNPCAVQDQLAVVAGLQHQLAHSEQALIEARRSSAEVPLPHSTAAMPERTSAILVALLHPEGLQQEIPA